MKVIKGLIKLYASTSKIKLGSIVNYNNSNLTVTSIDDCYINDDIPIHKVQLLKYCVSNVKGIIGELDYQDYNKIQYGIKVKVTTKEVLNKMEIGDEVRIFKPMIKLFLLFSKSNSNTITGTIVKINGRTATIDIHGADEQVKLKRHMFSLANNNIRIICKLYEDV